MPTEKTTRRAIVLAAVFFCFPEAAGAQGTFQIDTYGNGQFIAEVLNSIAILTGSGLLGLIRLGLVAGILLAVLSSLFGGRMVPGHQFALSILIYMMLFGVRVDVAVFDRVTSYTRVISAVPAGVGVFAWATSGVGSGLTRVMETAFSLPDALRYSKNGLLRGAELIKRSTAFTVAEPHLANTISSFVRECGLKGVTSGLISPDDLEKSADLFSSMGLSNYRFVELHTKRLPPPGRIRLPAERWGLLRGPETHTCLLRGSARGNKFLRKRLLSRMGGGACRGIGFRQPPDKHGQRRRLYRGASGIVQGACRNLDVGKEHNHPERHDKQLLPLG